MNAAPTDRPTLLAAAALLSGPGPSSGAGAGRAWRSARHARRGSRCARPDPLAVASSLDVLAVCLAAGMAVSTAAAATAPSAPPLLARVLRRAADLLALGADPAVAWSAPATGIGSLDPQIDALLRLARRSSVSGVALAEAVDRARRAMPAGRRAQRRRGRRARRGADRRSARPVFPAGVRMPGRRPGGRRAGR